MTTDTTPAVSSAPARRRRRPARTRVTAILADVDDLGRPASTEDLLALVAAVTGQDRTPDHLVLLRTRPAGGEIDPRVADALTGPDRDATTVTVVDAPGETLRSAVRATVERHVPPAPADGRSLVWLLDHGCTPEPDALGRLEQALRMSSGVAAAGPKLVAQGRTDRFVGFGTGSSAAGRLVPTPAPGELDQGQYDDGSDVLALAAPGLLVDTAALVTVGGYDRRLPPVAADLDLGWSAQERALRLVRVPGARIAVPAALGRTGARDDAACRAVALSHAPLGRRLAGALGGLVSGVGLALALLLGRRPRRAGLELAIALAGLRPRALRPPLARRVGGRPTTDVRPLLVPARVVRSRYVDETVDAPPPDAEDAPRSRFGIPIAHPLPWVLATVAVASILRWRAVPGSLVRLVGDGPMGGELGTPPDTPGGLVQQWWTGWTGAGWGGPAEPSPAVLPLAVLAKAVDAVPKGSAADSPVASAIALLLLLAPLAAALTAYAASRLLTPVRWPRALAALAWALGPVGWTATTTGRLGPAVALVLLPTVLADLAALGGRRSSTSRASRAGILGALLAALVPALGVLVLLGAVVLVVVARGRGRLRAVLVAVLTAGLLGPWVVRFVTDPARLLAGWGAVTDPGATDPLEPLRAGGPSWTAGLALCVLALLAFGGLATSRRPGPLGAATALVALGTAAALVAPRILLAGPEPVRPWSGTGWLVATAGALALGLLAADEALRPPELMVGRAPARTTRTAALVAAGVPVAALVGWGAALRAEPVLAPRVDPRPRVSLEQGIAGPRLRHLVLDVEGEHATARVLGAEGDEPARTLRRELPGGRDPLSVTPVAEDLLGGEVASAPPATRLGRAGIGFVSVTADVPPALVTRLDGSPGLLRTGSVGGYLTWRVTGVARDGGVLTGGPARVRLEDARRTSDVAVDRTGAADVMLEVPQGARLVVAERPAWSARAEVRIDDRPVAAQAGTAQPTYPVPPGRHRIVIDPRSSAPWWKVAQGGLLLLALYLLVPVARRRADDV